MEVNLKYFDTAMSKRPLWARLNPFHGELNLRQDTREELLRKAADHEGLVLRHGRRRVLSFYEERLLPALESLPDDPAALRALFAVRCRIAAMHATTEPSRRLTAMMRDLSISLLGARSLDNDFKTEARIFLAVQLSGMARRMSEQGRMEDAVRAYEILKQLGEMNADDRAAYVGLLWRANPRTPSDVPVYLAHLDDCHHADGSDPRLQEMAQFVEEQLTIDEGMPVEEVRQRLPFNQHACLHDGNSSTAALLHAGIGHLRLDEPDRAIGYLRRAQHQQDGGRASFHLGQALFQTDGFAEAADAFEQAATQGFSRSRIASWQGVAYAKAEQWDNALQTFRAAEAELHGSSDSEFYLQWGRASFLMGETEDAEQRFRRAFGIDTETAPPGEGPKSPHWRAAYGLAVCCEQLGRRDEAIGLLRQTTARADDAAPAFHLLGHLLQAEKNLMEAAACYRQAVAHSPRDTEYALSLGLALDDLGEAEGLAYLEQAAQAQAGGTEVIRRLVLSHRRQGNVQRMRHWLNRLAGEMPASDVVLRYQARDLASQAVETFNAGAYQQAIALWEQTARTFAGDPCVRKGLASALVYHTAARLRQGDADGVWAQIERAHQLSPDSESQFLYGFSRLAQGDFSNAQQVFLNLVAEQPDRAEHRFFEGLAAYFAGDEAAAERLTKLGAIAGASDLNSLLAFLQVQLAALRGDFQAAAERVETWVANQQAVRGLGLPRHQVNLLAAFCKIRGAGRRKQRIVGFFEKINEQYGDDYWGLALALVKHHLAIDIGIARAAEAEAATLDECAATYRALLDRSAAPAREGRQVLLRNYADLLQFIVRHRVGLGNVGAALDALRELRALPLPAAREIEELHTLLTERLSRPSHENAHALLEREPDRAREVWQALFNGDRDDLIALHHLACLAWSRAYDEAIAQRHEASIPFWREGLAWYRQLCERPDYWESLRQKGRALGQTAHSFDESAFEAWRGEALRDLARTVLDLIFHLTAGVDQASRGHEINQKVRLAKSLMEVMRGNALNASTQERLADELANHYLDPDPTNLPNLDASARRAGLVLDLDPANLKARCFLLRAITHAVDVRRKEGDRNYAGMAEQMAELKRHAEWLEPQLPALPEERRVRIKSDLVNYYDQVGAIRHEEGQQVVPEANTAREAVEQLSQYSTSYEVRNRLSNFKRHLERLRQCYQASDSAFQKSKQLDPVNTVAQDLMKRHREQYQDIEATLEQIGMAERRA